jgi:hypothetical protein
MFLLAHACYTSRPSHLIITDEKLQIMKLLTVQFSPLSCYFLPLMSKYSPQHPVLKHPQSVFLPYCERPSFTPIKRIRGPHHEPLQMQIVKLKINTAYRTAEYKYIEISRTQPYTALAYYSTFESFISQETCEWGENPQGSALLLSPGRLNKGKMRWAEYIENMRYITN